MREWISKIKRMVLGESKGAAEVRQALATAHRMASDLILESLINTSEEVDRMMTTIEEVRTRELVISQPLVGGMTRPLTSGEQLEMSFAVDARGYLIGETRVLGRVKIPSGGSKPLYGYRLALPDYLVEQDQRAAERTKVGFDLAPDAELHFPGDEEPVRGVIQDLSVSGMQVRTSDKNPGLQRGKRARLTTTLPPPVGDVDETVTIARLAWGRVPGQRIVGIALERELPGLSELIGETKTRRARRLR